MDWFEQLTGLSPDGGNGSYELAIVVVAIVVMASLVALIRKRSR